MSLSLQQNITFPDSSSTLKNKNKTFVRKNMKTSTVFYRKYLFVKKIKVLPVTVAFIYTKNVAIVSHGNYSNIKIYSQNIWNKGGTKHHEGYYSPYRYCWTQTRHFRIIVLKRVKINYVLLQNTDSNRETVTNSYPLKH